MAAADEASFLKADALPALKKMLRDSDSAVRYWAVLGILMRGKEAVQQNMKEMHGALGDDSPSVRVVAARALSQYGEKTDLDKALSVLLELARYKDESGGVALMAINAIDALDKNATGAIEQIKQLKPVSGQRTAGEYVARVAQDILANLHE